LNETIENLSPHAAAAYNMMQKGLTLTQIYTEYATVSEQLLIKTHDNEQLQSTFKSFLEVSTNFSTLFRGLLQFKYIKTLKNVQLFRNWKEKLLF